jgi:translocation and assembly module TamB
VSLTGDLARWRARAGGLTAGLAGLELGGQVELSSQLRYYPESIHFENTRLGVRKLHCRGMGLNIDEPSLDLTLAGRWVSASGALELKETHLACPTATVHYPSLSVVLDAGGSPLVTGSGTVQADMARVQLWLLAQPPASPGGPAARGPDALSGALAGQVHWRPSAGRQEMAVDLNIQNLVLVAPSAPAWREPLIHLSGQGLYDRLKGTFQIVQFHLDGPPLTCQAAGTVAHLSGSMDLTLAGTLGYDLARLEPLVRSYLGQSVQLSGQDIRPFRVSGALAGPAAQPLAVLVGPAAPAAPPGLLTRLGGEAAAGWQSLQAYGAQVGAAEVKARLSGGWLSFGSIDTTLNQGRLHLEPSVRLEPAPLDLYLARGKTIDHARLTPAVCASALGYALPVLADVAQAEGELSLELDTGRVPLADVNRAEAAGRFVIHQALVSPGPLVRELTVLLKAPSNLTLARENVVPFQVVNGRVYHRDLELHFPDLTIRTSGSVGFDGSLALVAEMPVPPRWLGSSMIGTAVAKQTIRLPIAGTLSKPRLDEQALRAASAKFARDTTGDVIRQELDKRLNKFLRPR